MRRWLMLCVCLGVLAACDGGSAPFAPPPSDPPPSDPEPSDPEPSDPPPSDPEPSDPEPSDPPPPPENLPTAAPFTTFESGHVRPLALSADGGTLLAVNTPDNCLKILEVHSGGLTPRRCVPVGLEPVAVAFRNDAEAWVVNHLSDSVSIVELGERPRVVRTLLVGDEPRDIVFAGPGNSHAFITTARRGQNSPVDPRLLTPGIGRANVWVFDVNDMGEGLLPAPAAIIELFTNTPRALAVSPDGERVYAAGFLTGNRTTALQANASITWEKDGPTADMAGNPAPSTGVIVQFDGESWVDDRGATEDLDGRVYGDMIDFELPDLDVFAIDVTGGNAPGVVDAFAGVGAVLFNMAVHPTSGAVYVSNTDARNIVRFEGEGKENPDADLPTVRGNFVRNRITVIDNGEVRPVHLNDHIDFDQRLGTAEESARSLAQPLDMVFSGDGGTLYVAAFGSNKVAALPTSSIEPGVFHPNTDHHIELSGGGPTGLALNADAGQLFVSTRFDNGISIVDISAGEEVGHVALFNPEPDSVVEGRPFLYDARLSSSRGDSSCASCHVFGDLDLLSWDLGDPDGVEVNNPNEPVPGPLGPRSSTFHPLKGPMTTQSLRGMANHGPMHWRGDRPGQENRLPEETLEEAAFKEFNPAFEELLARAEQLSEEEMQAFTDFVMQITYPPNPIRRLSGELTQPQAAGLDIYMNDITTGGIATCNDCHTLDPDAGFFGTAGLTSIEGPDVAEDFKVPHLRNVYQKVGMFQEAGPQVSGFGYLHDGSIDTMDEFLQASVFNLDEQARLNVVDFMFAFDSNLAPIVGQQVTLDMNATPGHLERMDLLIERALAGDCDLVFKGFLNDEPRGGVLNTLGEFQTDRSEQVLTVDALLAETQLPGQEMTLTCVPPGNGVRIGINRNEDDRLDGD